MGERPAERHPRPTNSTPTTTQYSNEQGLHLLATMDIGLETDESSTALGAASAYMAELVAQQ